MSTPSTYKNADRLGADGHAMCALGWSTWQTLTPAQRRAVVDASAVKGGLALQSHTMGGTTAGTARALQSLGIVSWTGDRWLLTGRGVMVREAGTRTPKGQDDG